MLFFGLAHHRPAHTLRIVRHEEVTVDEDRDGAVSFDSPRLTSSAAAVAVIDVETGGLALGRIDSFEGRAISVPGSGGRSEAGVGGDLLDLPGLAQVELVLVRPGSDPGSGAWGLRGGDGGGLDESGVPGEQDGRIVAPLSVLWPIGTSGEPPSTLASGDLLVVLDPHDLAVGAFELGVEGWVAR